ncbi:SdrD B-like domain-containing protein, partial [uncultured Croceitalea sp.]|uniref:SdrD B-like domain-containing protein n=1 Tax=uncultured Croceitalea sp. TaxID=1798908 RepID=UPI003305A0F1
DTNEPGYYSFEVCPNSGEYYIVFEDLPNGFEVTGQNTGDDALDSDIDENGRTDTFEVLEQDNLTIDAGIFEPCTIDPMVSNVDPICLGTEVTLTATGGDT